MARHVVDEMSRDDCFRLLYRLFVLSKTTDSGYPEDVCVGV